MTGATSAAVEVTAAGATVVVVDDDDDDDNDDDVDDNPFQPGTCCHDERTQERLKTRANK